MSSFWGYHFGGGGGGGYFGGGGGAYAGGGGGGSGYAPGGVTEGGVHSGPGRVVITYPATLLVPTLLPEDTPDLIPNRDTACSNSATHFDTVNGDAAGYTIEVQIHDSPTDVEVCTTVTNPSGKMMFDEDITVPKDTDPTDFLPPGGPPTVDEDAPDGEGPGSPCTSPNGAGAGTTSTRGYARTGENSSGEPVICVGFRAAGEGRHVRVTVH